MPAYRTYQIVGLLLGPLAFAAVLLAPRPEALSDTAWATAALAVWMAIWWATEAIPLAATALLTLAVQPLLGIADIGAAAAPFANPLIFLFLGGFLIALAMQRWELHRRIALNVVARAGSRPRQLVAGVMVACAALSMWISNTATAMMMLPIAASLVAVEHFDRAGMSERERTNFATALMLAVAYSASIGGLGTLIGSPPNALLASFMGQTYGITITFAGWMMIGLPVVLVMLPLAWFVLVRVIFPFRNLAPRGAEEEIADTLAEMGPMTTPQKRVAIVFALVAAAWIVMPLAERWAGRALVSDTGIAVIGAILLFAIPADWKKKIFLLDWSWAQRARWEVLLLFGGGLSLAQAIDRTGLAVWLGQGLVSLSGFPVVLLVAGVAALVILLTELTSNTATTAAFLPVVGAVAVGAGLDPMLLAAPAALAASCAFMLPVATPPNAIVYASGHVTVPQMVRAGALLNLAGVGAVTLVILLLAPLVAG